MLKGTPALRGSAGARHTRFRKVLLWELGGILATLGLLGVSSVRDEKRDRVQQAIASLGFQSASHVACILELVEMGFDVQARIVARSLLEALDLLQLSLLRPEVASEYVSCASEDEATSFWYRHVARGRISRPIRQQFVGIDGMSDWFEWREKETRVMGWAVHPSHMSGMASVLEFDPTGEATEFGFERGISNASDRTLTYCISGASLALIGASFAAKDRYGGLEKLLDYRHRLRRHRRLDAAARHVGAVLLLSDPNFLNEASIVDEAEKRLAWKV